MHLFTECEKLIKKNRQELLKAKKVKIDSTMSGSLTVKTLLGKVIFETEFVSDEWEDLQDGLILLRDCLESSGIEISE